MAKLVKKTKGDKAEPADVGRRISYKYRIDPKNLRGKGSGQIKFLNRDLEICRQASNWALDKKIIWYQETGKTYSQYQLQEDLKELKQIEPKYQLVYSGCLIDVLIRLERSYQNFFRRVKEGTEKPGFPKFKKYGSHTSMTRQYQGKKENLFETSTITNKKGVVKTETFINFSPRLPKIKIIYDRPLPEGEVKTITLSRDGHKYFIIFSMKSDIQPPRLNDNPIRSIKFKLGDGYLARSDRGYIIPKPKIYEKYEKNLAEVNRRMDKIKMLPPDDPEKMEIRIAQHKIHNTIRNKRREDLRKIAINLANNFQKIEIDKGSIKDLKKSLEEEPNPEINKSTLDTAYYEFTFFLKWICEKRGLIYKET